MKKRLLFLINVIVLTSCVEVGVYEMLQRRPELSQITALIEKNEFVKEAMLNRELTLFAPSDLAFQRYSGEVDDSLVLYHMTNKALSVPHRQLFVPSDFYGNPPLWVSKIVNSRNGNYSYFYVNEAKVNKSNTFEGRSPNGKRQVLHVIEEVLRPIRLRVDKSDDTSLHNPTAYQLIEKYFDYDIGPHRLRLIREKMHELQKMSLYEDSGHFTFFIPVDTGFENPNRINLFDERILEAHVVPQNVLFPGASSESARYPTLFFSENTEILASFTTVSHGDEQIYFAKSETLIGDGRLTAGVVIADIVRANIPVKNGVIHLIQKPLVIVDTPILQILEERGGGILRKFYEMVMDLGSDNQILHEITHAKNLTLFVPTSDAWDELNATDILEDKQKLIDILKLHIVYERISTATIINRNVEQIYQVQTAANRKCVYFNIISKNNVQVLSVESGGVNATVLISDVAATNGYIHVIDKVFGIPYFTIADKLESDPMLHITYKLGERTNFNRQLGEDVRRYTYFVPRDSAWLELQSKHPITFHNVMNTGGNYYLKQIMERHLIKADQVLTMSDLKLLANETHPFVIPTTRNPLRLRLKETDRNYFIGWNGEWIHVFRPDVECTNGIIHVIDKVFIVDDDIHSSGNKNNIDFYLLLVALFVIFKQL